MRVPVTLRLGRPRPESAKILGLDCETFFEYSEGMIRNVAATHENETGREDGESAAQGVVKIDAAVDRQPLQHTRAGERLMNVSKVTETGSEMRTASSRGGLSFSEGEDAEGSVLPPGNARIERTAHREAAIACIATHRNISTSTTGHLFSTTRSRKASGCKIGALPTLFPLTSAVTGNVTRIGEDQGSMDSADISTSRRPYFKNHDNPSFRERTEAALIAELEFRSSEAWKVGCISHH